MQRYIYRVSIKSLCTFECLQLSTVCLSACLLRESWKTTAGRHTRTDEPSQTEPNPPPNTALCKSKKSSAKISPKISRGQTDRQTDRQTHPPNHPTQRDSQTLTRTYGPRAPENQPRKSHENAGNQSQGPVVQRSAALNQSR